MFKTKTVSEIKDDSATAHAWNPLHVQPEGFDCRGVSRPFCEPSHIYGQHQKENSMRTQSPDPWQQIPLKLLKTAV